MHSTPIRIGDFVIHKAGGVCKVTEMQTVETGDLPPKEYYVLSPVDGDGRLLVPTESEAARNLMKIPDKDEIDRMLARVKNEPIPTAPNARMRVVLYERLLGSGEREKILLLLRILREKKSAADRGGTKLSNAEERLLVGAEKIVSKELTFAMNLSERRVSDYLDEQLGIPKTQPPTDPEESESTNPKSK